MVAARLFGKCGRAHRRTRSSNGSRKVDCENAPMKMLISSGTTLMLGAELGQTGRRLSRVATVGVTGNPGVTAVTTKSPAASEGNVVWARDVLVVPQNVCG